jgi:hypothetical protein
VTWSKLLTCDIANDVEQLGVRATFVSEIQVSARNTFEDLASAAESADKLEVMELPNQRQEFIMSYMGIWPLQKLTKK